MPEVFGRYQLLKKLAVGGMAEIWLARQQGLEGFSKLLVIKRILPHLAENDEFVKMFLDEARIAARLNHANVVQIFDLGEAGAHYFIAMEYLHGEDARRVWKQAEQGGHPMPLAMACRIVIDACAGLDYAHKRADETGRPLHIVHRDVSPQNIIVTYEGNVKVVDFGIAKAVDQISVTRSGVVKGKYSYMSPEQASGSRTIDHRTDQFALGIVLYELCTGARLFKRATDLETLRAVDRCQVMPMSQVNSRVPESLDPIVLKALAHDPDDRYPDCRAFQMAIDGWLLENRIPSSSAELAQFMGLIYADKLAAEKQPGQPLWEEISAIDLVPSDVSAKPPDGAFDGAFDGQPDAGTPRGNPTAVAKPSRSVSQAGSQPSGRRLSLPALPALDLAVGDRIPTAESKLPPPVASSPSLRAAEARPASLKRKAESSSVIPRRPTHRERPQPTPAPRMVTGLDADDGNTVSESATVATLSGAAPAPSAPAPGSRRGLWVGLATAAVVLILGGLALWVLGRPGAPTAALQIPQALPVNGSAGTAVPKTGPETPLTDARVAHVGIETEPPGAQVTVDGEDRGKSPLAPAGFAVGSTLHITAHLAGYAPATRTYAVKADDTFRVKLVAAAAEHGGHAASHGERAGRATLVLESPVPLAATLDGKAVPIPGRAEVPAGHHRLKLASSALDLNQTVELSAHAGETLTPSIAPGVGKLRVVVKNLGYGNVWVGGVKHGQTPMPAFNLAAGTHSVMVKNPDSGKSQTVSVKVTAGQTTTVSVDLD